MRQLYFSLILRGEVEVEDDVTNEALTEFLTKELTSSIEDLDVSVMVLEVPKHEKTQELLQ